MIIPQQSRQHVGTKPLGESRSYKGRFFENQVI
jgi:hypothetical protein